MFKAWGIKPAPLQFLKDNVKYLIFAIEARQISRCYNHAPTKSNSEEPTILVNDNKITVIKIMVFKGRTARIARH